MKKAISIMVVLLLTLGFCMYPRTYAPMQIEKIDDNKAFRVLTYNIKNSYQDPQGWQKRRESLLNHITEIRPDIMGLQEVDPNWMTYLTDNLEDYLILGMGRDGDNQGEHNLILYLKSKFELIDSGTFWLSETPYQVSRGWDGACNRICTYAELKHKDTGQVFLFANTHLDHKGKLAKENGARLLTETLKTLHPNPDKTSPIILMGDMNTLQGSSIYKIFIEAGFKDSKKIAENTMSFGTVNYFTKLHFRLMPPIDFILIDDGQLQLEKQFKVNTYKVLHHKRLDGLPFSDHFPVYVDVSFKVN